MLTRQFIDQLSHRLRQPMPGLHSHLKMAPRERLEEIKYGKPAMHPKPSGVLVSLYPMDGSLGTLLIKRTVNQSLHSGQISFPGGKKDDGDQSVIHTALREANEELGIDPAGVQVIGSLSPLYVPPSNFIIYPIVGIIDDPQTLLPNAYEVEYAIQMPLSLLAAHTSHTDMVVRGYSLLQVPCFSLNGHIIWGATAMILQELLDVLEEIR